MQHVVQSPGASGTAGVHSDVKVEGYSISPDGGHAMPVVSQNIPPRKIRHMTTFAAELECSEKDTRHWIHRWCVDHNNGEPAKIPPILAGTSLEPTVPNCVAVAAEKFVQQPCMGVRPILEELVEGKKKFWKKGPYTWRSYGEVFQDINYAAKGILGLPGISDKRKQKQQVVAALLAETTQEWMISAQAAMACGITLTTVYSTLGPEAMLHGLQQTEAEIIFMDFLLFETLKESVLAKCPALRHIIFIGKDLCPQKTTGGRHYPFPSPQDAVKLGPVGEAHCTTLLNLILHGSRSQHVNMLEVAPAQTDIAMIMYTSGSTGKPKGVVLTHINFVSVVAAACAQNQILPRSKDVLIGYLPLAHIFELLVETVTLTQVSVHILAASVFIHGYLYTHVHRDMCLGVCVFSCMYGCVCVCVCGCVCVCICIYIYIYTYTYIPIY